MKERMTDSDVVAGRWLLGLLAAIAVAVGIYFWVQRGPEEPAQQTTAPVAGGGEETPAPVEHPVETPAEAPLPALDESDAEAVAGFAPLFPEGRFEQLFAGEDLIRRITVTVDNLPRQKVAMRLRPVRPMPDEFVASGAEMAPVLDESNFARYRSYVAVLEAVDGTRAAVVYRRLYPLFQEAYEELGHPSAYFNDRVIDVIDHLLEAPEVRGPIPLVRPNVLYEFADPGLEARSAGQKFLIRMGPENAVKVKAWLRAFRAELVS